MILVSLLSVLPYAFVSGEPDDSNLEEVNDNKPSTNTAVSFEFNKVVDKQIALSEDILIYTLYYNNTGNSTSPTVWINETLPAEVAYISSTVPPDILVGQSVCWVFNNVTPGNYFITLTVQIIGNLTLGTVLNNTVYFMFDPVLIPDYYYANTTIGDGPSFWLLKTVDKAFGEPGEILTYTIEFFNNGTESADYVWINETLPIQVTYISNSAGLLPEFNGISFLGQEIFFAFVNVPLGSHSFEVTVQIDQSAQDGIVLSNYATCEYSPSGMLI